MKRSVWLVVVALAALALPPSAQAAFPGQNGRIAFASDRNDPNPTGCFIPACNFEIYSMDADGSGSARLTTDPGQDLYPAWSPDGTKIAFTSTRAPDGLSRIYVMNADGSGVVQVAGVGGAPTWSPDGTEIAYASGGAIVAVPAGGGTARLIIAGTCDENDTAPCHDYQGPAWSPAGSLVAVQRRDVFDPEGSTTFSVAIVRADGSGQVNQFPSFSSNPDWSPSADQIAYSDGAATPGNLADLWRASPGSLGGSGATPITDTTAYENFAAWAPEGGRIAFTRRPGATPNTLDIYTANPSGGAVAQLTSTPGDDTMPDWQPIPINSYPRPKGATPLRVSLALAYNQCTAPDRTHGPPLAFPACASPQKSSSQLTVGTGDSNGLPARNEGSLTLNTLVGAPGGPDDADVRLDLFMDDVFTNALADYGGEIRAHVALRITDKDNTPHPGGPGAATTTEIPLDVIAPCIGVASPQDGSVCSVSTSADALAPGTVKETRRSIWQLGRAEVYDGGPDGDANTPAGDTLFATQGVFIP